ncbi:MAG TPA: cbb3-type cytochrome c oxidase subunit I, partial [Longimicrobiaceae bacterium]
SGVMHASAPSDLQQSDTYFIVAHIHYVFFGGTVLGLWAALYYWYPKVFGRLLDERMGQFHFWGTFIGMNLTFFPMHFVGMFGMPRRTWTYGPEQGFTAFNQVETVGAFIIALATLVFAINLFTAWKRGRIAGPNPWGAATLEWSIPSPPPVYNFREIPVVHSRMPLWEDDPTKEAGIPHGRVEEETEQVTLAGTQVAAVRDVRDENKMSAHDLGIHLPPPSFWPIVLAAGISSIFIGLIFRQVPATSAWHNAWYLMFAGVATTVLSIYAWAFEPGH